MAKFCGNVGYVFTEETVPGVFEEKLVERKYYGDIIKNRVNVQQNNVINGSITINNTISIVTDQFANEHVMDIRCVTYLGKKWCVTGIDPAHPRILLTLGGLYNG